MDPKQLLFRPKIAGALLLALLIACLPGMPTIASEDVPVTWEKAIMLSDPTVDSWPPSVTTDAAGNVHVIWSQSMDPNLPAGEGDTIYYTRFNGTQWTKPTDILVSPVDYTQWPDITYTPDGMVHVIWGTSGQNSRLMYAHAPACCAEDVRQWSVPKIIYMPILESAVIVGDAQNRLHIAYASQETNNIYYQRSDDGGNTWNPPVILPSFTSKSDEQTIWPRLSVDTENHVHLVWTLIPWPGQKVVYARSDDGGNTWNSPVIIDNINNPAYRAGFGPIVITVNAFANNEVHMFWDGAPTVERNHIWSSDGGQTWTAPEIVFPEVTSTGRTGYNHMVKDSNGILHAVSIHGNAPARHATWDGKTWSNSTEIPTNEPIEQPKLVITQGNTLHLIWTSKMRRPYTTWYIRGTINNAPEIPGQTLPTLAAPTAIAEAPIELPAPIPTAYPLPNFPTQQANNISSSPALGIIIGTLPAILLVGAITWFNFRRNQKLR
jgi:hypothetical protein